MEACILKAKYGMNAVFWAGGTDLLLEWRDGIVDLEYCIDLSYLFDLNYIRDNKNQVCIGSLTRVASIEESSVVNKVMPVLSEAASRMASPQIRNIATVGGNLCHAAPSADLAVPLLALGAEVKLLGPSGERRIALEDFFLGVNETALKEDELLMEIRVPIPPPETAASFLKVGRTVVDIAIVNAAVGMTIEDGGTVTHVRVAVGAVSPTPMRSKVAEEQLIGAKIADLNRALLEDVSRKAAAETKPITDIRASAEYRRKICETLVRRALENVIEKLGRGRRP
jgi:carbon-monoxide dehydrogenase medium subunit